MAEAHGTPKRPALVADMIAESLMPGRTDVLRGLFLAHGARTPVVIWSPLHEDLRHPMLRRFTEVCMRLASTDGEIRVNAFDLSAFGVLRDWMMLVEPDGESYRYLHYGPGIASHYGRDMTGRSTSDIGGYVQTFFEAIYHAARERREWVLSEHEPPSSVFVRQWRRLIVPLMDDGGQLVERFAVINLPENELRAGLDLIADPVFVMDNEHVVQYANRAACRSYGLSDARAPGPTLRQLTGLELEGLPPLEEMLVDARLMESVELTLEAGIADRQGITVSAAEHRGRMYYVVLIHRIGL
jgi:PAS domain-containing protein